MVATGVLAVTYHNDCRCKRVIFHQFSSEAVRALLAISILDVQCGPSPLQPQWSATACCSARRRRHTPAAGCGLPRTQAAHAGIRSALRTDAWPPHCALSAGAHAAAWCVNCLSCVRQSRGDVGPPIPSNRSRTRTRAYRGGRERRRARGARDGFSCGSPLVTRVEHGSAGHTTQRLVVVSQCSSAAAPTSGTSAMLNRPFRLSTWTRLSPMPRLQPLNLG